MDTNVCRLHIDGEMLGSIPGKHPLVEIGCCSVDESKARTFSVLIRPPEDAPYEYGAREVLRRPFEEYVRDGLNPQDASHAFIEFLKSAARGRKLEISCVNPGFDIGFIKFFLSAYADDETGAVGYKSYDIVSYACAAFRLPLTNMSKSRAWSLLRERHTLIYDKHFAGEGTHTALTDALSQTTLFCALEEMVRLGY